MAPMSAGEQRELVEAMLDPSFYPDAPRSVELRETHISWVFLAGELAYKVKKPVTFTFLDYGSLERRHEMCRDEVRLNRRLAPEIYLQVVGIARRGGRYSLTSEQDPAAIEFAVEMRRVEEDRSLASLAVRGELGTADLERVARRLARFHDDASIAPPERRGVEVLVATLDENLATLREAGADVVGERRVDVAEGFTHRFLAARRGELEARARAGLVGDCHGDLRAEHVIVPPRREAYVYDCVEFDPALRQIDVSADISFLVMDLARLGVESVALRLVDEYRRAGGDPGDDALLSFFASYRAWVRAKISCLRAAELPDEAHERRRQEADARELLRLGHRFAWGARRPLVLIVCGVAGTGKTTLARELAELSGWAQVNSDVTRKRLAGLAATERGGAELYSWEMTGRTYRELGGAAAEEFEGHGGVIVDATFHRRAERDEFRAGFGDLPGPLLFVECRAAPEVLRARVRERGLERVRVSDADEAVLERQLTELEPLEEVPPERRTGLATDAAPDELVSEVEAFVDQAIWPMPGAVR
jgi:aminoglycoside phosphotransferase family enzyme/predicted kinase